MSCCVCTVHSHIIFVTYVLFTTRSYSNYHRQTFQRWGTIPLKLINKIIFTRILTELRFEEDRHTLSTKSTKTTRDEKSHSNQTEFSTTVIRLLFELNSDFCFTNAVNLDYILALSEYCTHWLDTCIYFWLRSNSTCYVVVFFALCTMKFFAIMSENLQHPIDKSVLTP